MNKTAPTPAKTGQTAEQDARQQAVSIAMQQIEKEFGKGSIMKMGESMRNMDAMPVVHSGSLALDLALGVGGFVDQLFIKYPRRCSFP